MANARPIEPFQLGMVEESLSRFSLRSRKSSYSRSYTSSSNAASSATSESMSDQSSRPSLVVTGRRRSSLASFSSRLKKGKKSSLIGDIQEHGQDGNNNHTSLTLGQRFYELPAEVQTSVLAYLSTTELLSLRSTSKQCLAIFQANASTIARNVLSQPVEEDPNGNTAFFPIDLYPSLFASTTTDAYLLRSLRRNTIIRRQLNVLLTFIQTRVYMLRLTRGLESDQFTSYRRGLYSKLYYPVGLVQHFLETIRHLIVYAHPDHLSPYLKLDQCPACTRELKRVISSYPDALILPVYQTIQLLVQHFRTATRTPSSVSALERRWRGWDYGPPPEDHMAQLVLLGGMQELSNLDEMHGSYTKRLRVVKNFADTVIEAVRVNGIQFPDFYQTQTDPVMAMAGGPPAKGRRASPKLKHRDRDDVRTAIEACADEKSSITQSLDVRLDLLTEQMIKSIPNLEKLLVGPETLLARRIKDLNLVEDDSELLSPYGFVQRLMAESYRPEASGLDEQEPGHYGNHV